MRLVRPGDEDSSEGGFIKESGYWMPSQVDLLEQSPVRSTYDGSALGTIVHTADLSDSHTSDVFSHGGSTIGRILGNAINTLLLVGLLRRRTWD